MNGAALDLGARGQADGLVTSPLFVARDPAGTTLAEEGWLLMWQPASATRLDPTCARPPAVRRAEPPWGES